MEKLTPQENKVYRFILENPGSTTQDITDNLRIQCPSARLTGLRRKGVPLTSIGQKKYPNARAFEMYAISEPKQEALL